MSTVTATAHASSTSSDAIAAATRDARSRLGGATPAYGFLFVTPTADLASALRVAREAAGTPNLVGCTTAGEITERGLGHGGAAVMLVAGEATIQVGFATGLKAAPRLAASTLLQGLAETKRVATARDHRHVSTVLLTDGLTGTAERLLDAIYDARIQAASQFIGGAAADESAFKATHVGALEHVGTDAAVALHVFSPRAWGVGVGHGLTPTTRQMRVTRAQDNVVYEINGEPAFAVYERHAAERGIRLTREDAQRYMVENELGIHFFERVSRARAPLFLGADGSLACAAEVPQGSMVSILSGEPARMLEAARLAASEAHARLGGARAAGVLMFDCVCRGAMLGDGFAREIDAVRSVFGNVPIAGFLTYGEIARLPGHLDGWHNSTVVVVAIPA